MSYGEVDGDYNTEQKHRAISVYKNIRATEYIILVVYIIYRRHCY